MASSRTIIVVFAVVTVVASLAAQSATPASLDDAKALIANGKYADAIPVLESIVASDKASASQALWLTGQCHEGLHDWSKAIGSYRRLLSGYPNSVRPDREVKAEIMACHLQNHETDDCLALRNELLSEYQSDSWRLYRIVGRGYVYRHEHAKAIAELKKSIELAPRFSTDPELVEAKRWLLHSYVELGQWADAVALGERLLKDHPDEGYLWHYELGRCYRGEKKYDKAIRSFETVTELPPKDAPILADVFKMLLDCYNSTTQWDKAANLARKLMEAYADEPRWRLEYGRFCLEKQDFISAVPVLRQALPDLKANWEIRKCHIYLGECLYRLGRGQEALKGIEDYYKDKPDLWDERLIAKSAVLLYGGKDYAASIMAAKAVLARAAGGEATPHVFTAHEMLNRAYENLGEWELAASSLEELALDSGQVGYLSRAGQYYIKASNYTQAKRVYKKVLSAEHVPDDTRAACMYGLAMCYESDGLSYAATRLMHKLCRDYPDTEGAADAMAHLSASSQGE